MLLSLPCIGAIRAGAGHVHLAGRSDVVKLMKETGYADGISFADSVLYSPLYAASTEGKTGEFLAQFDRAFLFTSRGDSPLAASLGRVIPCMRTILTIPPADVRKHVAEFRFEQAWGGSGREHPYPVLEIPPASVARAEDLLAGAGYKRGRDRLVAIHPGSGGRKKCWPLESYFALAERVRQEHGTFLLFLSGPAEDTEKRERIRDFVRSRDRSLLIPGEELVVVAALLSSCTLYIGNDSGVTHLAAAVGGECIALFGPTDPYLWRPVGLRAQVIDAGYPCDSLSSLPVDEVYTRVAAVLGSSQFRASILQ